MKTLINPVMSTLSAKIEFRIHPSIETAFAVTDSAEVDTFKFPEWSQWPQRKLLNRGSFFEYEGVRYEIVDISVIVDKQPYKEAPADQIGSVAESTMIVVVKEIPQVKQLASDSAN